MRPDTDCIFVYGFAMDIVTDYSQLTQGSVREDASYSCITMIFEGGVVSNSYEKCFFQDIEGCKMDNKSDSNRKHVIDFVLVIYDSFMIVWS